MAAHKAHDWVKTVGVDAWHCPTCGAVATPDWSNIRQPQVPCKEIPARRVIDGVIVDGPPS
jgi:hypothetical protein